MALTSIVTPKNSPSKFVVFISQLEITAE